MRNKRVIWVLTLVAYAFITSSCGAWFGPHKTGKRKGTNTLNHPPALPEGAKFPGN